MSAVDLPHQRVPTGRDDIDGRDATGAERPRGGALQRTARSSAFWSVIVCIVLGALSAAVLPTIPSYDPWSWIVWGREITDPHLNFVISGGPSWKPLPLVFTTIWGVFGGPRADAVGDHRADRRAARTRRRVAAGLPADQRNAPASGAGGLRRSWPG